MGKEKYDITDNELKDEDYIFIEKTFKSYTKSKVNIQAINKLIKVTRDGIKFIGKKVKFFEVGACLWKLCDDLNNMSYIYLIFVTKIQKTHNNRCSG